MSRTTTFISILLLFVLILVGAWWWLFFEKGSSPVSSTASSTRPQAFSPLNPNNTNQQQSSTTISTQEDPIIAETPGFTPKKVRKLYSTPVAYGITASSTASSSSVFFVDRGTGHVYNMSIEEEKPNKISNTTILRVFESIIDPKAKNIVLRYIKEGSEIITTIFAPINTEIKAKNATNNAYEITVSPKGDRIFSLEKTVSGISGYISKIDGTSKTLVFDSPLSEWLVSWPEEGTIALTTRASYTKPGYLFLLNTKTGESKKVLGPVYGLTTNVSTDGKRVLFSLSESGKLSTKILNLADGSIQTTLLQTLPEKCIWSIVKKTSIYCAVPNEPAKNMPDDWYKGLVNGVDQIWHLDTVTNDIGKISNLLTDTGTLIDAVNLTLDNKEFALYFINQYDLSLWSVDLRE